MKKGKVLIIAEAGVNHNGSMSMAKQLIDEAARSGADVVKFQTFHAASLVTSSAAKASYQKKNTKGRNSQLEMLQSLELSYENHVALMNHAERRKIRFLSTPFDDASIDLLKKLGIDTGKIPSGEITSLPYLKKMAATFKNILLSTGMSDLDEIAAALDV
jgi:N,N'-diacetyllegionaminate synthase